jgi:hypothetical protein
MRSRASRSSACQVSSSNCTRLPGIYPRHVRVDKVAGGATPGSSVQQWVADLIAHLGSDPVHQSFAPALRSDQPDSR